MSAAYTATLSPALAALARQHVALHPCDADEIVPELWIALLEAPAAADPGSIYATARSRCRRYTQDPAHYSCALDVADVVDVADDRNEDEDGQLPEGVTWEMLEQAAAQLDVDNIMRTRGVRRSRAYQIRAQGIEQLRRRWRGGGQGDLFAAGGAV